MVKHIANINSYILSIDSTGILNAPGLKSGVIEHPTGGTGNQGNYIVADGSGGWSWSSPIQTPSVAALNDLTDAITDATSIYLGSNSGLNATGSNNIALGQATLNELGNVADYNVAIGNYSLQYVTTGQQNVAVGTYAGRGNGSSVSGSRNVFTGYESGLNITSGNRNIGIGAASLYTITSGTQNIGIGAESLYKITSGTKNIGIGTESLYNITSGHEEIAIGYRSMYSRTTGSRSIAIGSQTLKQNCTLSIAIGYRTAELSTGDNNIAIGSYALQYGTVGFNTAIGQWALMNISGHQNIGIGIATLGQLGNVADYNVAIGNYSLQYVTTGEQNVAVGTNAGRGNGSGISGFDNVFTGYKSAYNITSGNRNVGIGAESLYTITSGDENTAIGYKAGYGASTNQNCTFVGFNAQASANNTTNETVIGAGATGNGSNTVTIGNSNTIELYLPGLQSGASNGDVLTFDGSKIVLVPPALITPVILGASLTNSSYAGGTPSAVVLYDNVEYQTVSCYNTSTGVFTAPRTAYYMVNAYARVSDFQTPNASRAQSFIYKKVSGTFTKYSSTDIVDTEENFKAATPRTHIIIYLNSGEEIRHEVVFPGNTGSGFSIRGDAFEIRCSYLSIHSIN